MSMMFLNPFDHSGLGLYSKAAKSLVERMPVLAKQRKPKGGQRYYTQEDEQYTPDQGIDGAAKTEAALFQIKKKSSKLSEPFSKSLSREQRILGQDGKNRNPAVGAYHPKQILKEPKYVWNILGAYQRSTSHKKQILDRKQKGVNSLTKREVKERVQKEQQNPEGESGEISKHQQELWDNMVEPEEIKFDKFKFRNSSPFVDMKRMRGRDDTSAREQESYIDTLESDENSGAFLTCQPKTQSPGKSSGTIQFKKQLSREKVSSLFKRNSNLVYDCNYSLVCANSKIGPDFHKMVNRDGKSIQTEMNDQQCPDYSQIWLNRIKKSLPNLQMILKKKMEKQRAQKGKREGGRYNR